MDKKKIVIIAIVAVLLIAVIIVCKNIIAEMARSKPEDVFNSYIVYLQNRRI